MPNPVATCRHCRLTRSIRGRGLCHFCYEDKETRVRYPLLHREGRLIRKHREPTEAEVEALIRENLPTMPAFEKEPGETAELYTSSHCVRLCPRGARVIKGRRFAR